MPRTRFGDFTGVRNEPGQQLAIASCPDGALVEEGLQAVESGFPSRDHPVRLPQSMPRRLARQRIVLIPPVLVPGRRFVSPDFSELFRRVDESSSTHAETESFQLGSILRMTFLSSLPTLVLGSDSTK